MALRTGAELHEAGEGETNFRLDYWSKAVEISYPAFEMVDAFNREPLAPFEQLMLAIYFQKSDGMPLSGEWISFSQLPDGQFYAQAFDGYTSRPLLQAFGNDLAGFKIAAAALRGREPWVGGDLGDGAFVFPVLPRVSLMAVYWLGDDEFPSSYRILFDSTISHHLTTDSCAILGSALSKKMIKIYKSEQTSVRN